MKKVLVFLFACFLSQAVWAQSGDVVSAYQYFQNFQNYKDLKELEKAKKTIDEAMLKLKEKGIDNQVDKLTTKAYYYKGMIYSALAGFKDKPELSKDATSEAYTAYLKSMETDDPAKPKFKKDALNALLLLSQSLYQTGFDAYKNGDYNTAYGYFSKVMNINDMMAANAKKGEKVAVDTLTIVATASAADRAGKKAESKDLYQKLIDLNYKDVTIYTSLSNIYREEKNDDKANEVLAAGRKQFPTSKELIIEEVNYMLKTGKQKEAIGKMEEAAKLDEKNASLQFVLATTYEALGDKTKALEAYNKALELDPKYFDALYNMGLYYYNQAAEKIRQMNDVDVNDQAKYDRLKKESDELFNQALPFFLRASEANDKDQNTWIALREIYVKTGNLTKANEIKKKLEE